MGTMTKKLFPCSTLVIFGIALLTTTFAGQSTGAVTIKKTIVDKQIELSGIQGEFFPFTVPNGVSDVHLSGNIKVIGGLLTQVYIAVYKNCQVTGSSGSTAQFLKCKPILADYFDNSHNSFSQY